MPHDVMRFIVLSINKQSIWTHREKIRKKEAVNYPAWIN
jgi:hypothetical protein